MATADSREVEDEFEGLPYQLGAPIELADFLALPPDGNRYDRDEEGRLVLMTMDHAHHHGWPLTVLARTLIRSLPAPYSVLQERGVAFQNIYDLRGRRVRESFFGPKSLCPDIVVLAGEPLYVRGPRGNAWFSQEGVVLVVEILSETTWRSDLGLRPRRRADDVDRKRTYLESGVPEYWVVNPASTLRKCPLPPRSVWSGTRREDGSGWDDLPPARSVAVPGLALDLDAFWKECGL